MLYCMLVGRRASLQPAPSGWMVRCRCCCLLQQHGKSIVQHFRICHLYSSGLDARQKEKYEPEHFLRRVVVHSASPVITRLTVGADAFVVLALRQPGSIASLGTAHALVAVFTNRLAHVTWGESRGETIRVAEWHWTT